MRAVPTVFPSPLCYVHPSWPRACLRSQSAVKRDLLFYQTWGTGSIFIPLLSRLKIARVPHRHCHSISIETASLAGGSYYAFG